MIRVLLVDDQLVVRRGLRALLADYPDIAIAAEAESGPSAVEIAEREHPDVVLMDVHMPRGDGITATRDLTAGSSGAVVIVLTTFDLDEYVFGALEAGAVGFLLKDADIEDMVAAVRAAARGDGMVAPAITRRVIAEFARRGQTPGHGHAEERTDDDPAGALTPRETEIVKALSQGQSNDQIAEALHLEAGTVKVHLSRIMAKLDLSSRVQVVVWAFRNGIAS